MNPAGHGPQGSHPRSPRADLGVLRDAPFLRKLWRSTRDRWHRFAVGGFVVWAAYTLLLSPQGWIQLSRLQQRTQLLRGNVRCLEGELAGLDRTVAELDRRGPEVLEKRAREEFGFLRPNERIYALPYDAEDARCLREAEVYGSECFSDRARRLRREALEVRASGAANSPGGAASSGRAAPSRSSTGY